MACATCHDLGNGGADTRSERAAGARAPASRVALGLGDAELADLVEFLRALDGDPLPPALIGAPALP